MRAVAIVVLFSLAGVIAAVATPARAAPVPKHLMKPTDPDEEKIQGQWQIESIRLGKDQNLQLPGGMTFEIRGTKMTATTPEGINAATFKINVVNGLKRFSTTNVMQDDGKGNITRQEDQSFGYRVDENKFTLAMTIKDRKAVDPDKAKEGDIVVVMTRLPNKK